jgi:hypothetical protein
MRDEGLERQMAGIKPARLQSRGLPQVPSLET